MVLGVVLETVPEFLRERVVEFHLQVPQVLSYGDAFPAEHAAVGELVDFAHESPCVETEGVAAFLELVQFLEDGDRYDDVVFLEVPDRLVVVQYYIGIQHEYLGQFPFLPFFWNIGVLCHDYMVLRDSPCTDGPGISPPLRTPAR